MEQPGFFFYNPEQSGFWDNKMSNIRGKEMDRIGLSRAWASGLSSAWLGPPFFISNFVSTTSMKFSFIEPSSSIFVTFL